MDWAEEWSRAVLNASSRKGWTLFSKRDFAQWYDLQLKYSDYPGIFLEKIQNRLKKNYTLLDIGAGTGAFAIPISKKIRKVTAVEPSREMAGSLREKMNGQKNIHIVNKWWEDVKLNEINMHDMVIAANSLYQITDIVSALKKMLSLVKKHLYIIMSCRSDFYNDIWRQFKREAYHPPPTHIHLYNILYELGVLASIEMIKIKHSYVYLDMSQAVKYWSVRLDLDKNQKDHLRLYLENKLGYIKDKPYYEEEGYSAIIWYDKE